jgi:hypothetical protein
MEPSRYWEDWLEMPLDQGGRRFGPLPDRVRIGADPAVCDIVLGNHLGMPPIAVELRRNDRGTWTLEHTQATAWPCTLLAPDQVGAGRSARSGSRFTPGESMVLEGRSVSPRFLLRRCPSLIEPLPDEGPAVLSPDSPTVAARTGAVSSAPGPAQKLTSGLVDEAKRRAMSEALASNQTAQEIDQLSRLARQRVWTSPTTIVAVGIGCASMLFAAISAAAMWLSSHWGLS